MLIRYPCKNQNIMDWWRWQQYTPLPQIQEQTENSMLPPPPHMCRGHPRGQFGRKSLPKLADFSLSWAEGEVKCIGKSKIWTKTASWNPEIVAKLPIWPLMWMLSAAILLRALRVNTLIFMWQKKKKYKHICKLLLFFFFSLIILHHINNFVEGNWYTQ